MKRNSKKNKKRFSRIIPALWGLACLLIFAGVLFAGLGNYHRELQENPIQGISAGSSFKGYLGTGYAYAGQQENSQNGDEAQGEQAQLLDEEEQQEDSETEEAGETEEADLTDGESENRHTGVPTRH